MIEENVGEPVAVAFRAFPDLSDQVLTVAPLDGGVPVPSGSAPSYHALIPTIDVGVKLLDVATANVVAFDSAFPFIFTLVTARYVAQSVASPDPPPPLPAGPVGPVTPEVGPVAPVQPVAPTAPVGPVNPVGPVAPVGAVWRTVVRTWVIVVERN